MQYRSSGFTDMPPVVKNLIIINVLVWIIQIMLRLQDNYFLDEYKHIPNTFIIFINSLRFINYNIIK